MDPMSRFAGAYGASAVSSYFPTTTSPYAGNMYAGLSNTLPFYGYSAGAIGGLSGVALSGFSGAAPFQVSSLAGGLFSSSYSGSMTGNPSMGNYAMSGFAGYPWGCYPSYGGFPGVLPFPPQCPVPCSCYYPPISSINEQTINFVRGSLAGL